MIFWIWRSYFIRWQIFENKVWCPVSKKRRRYFHFLLSLAYPIDRLDWALFSVVILFHHLVPRGEGRPSLVKWLLSLSYYDIMIHIWTLWPFFSQAIPNSNLSYRDGFGCPSFVPGLMFVLLAKVLRTCDFVMAGIFWPLDQVSWSFCARTTFTSMYSVAHSRFYILDFYSCST